MTEPTVDLQATEPDPPVNVRAVLADGSQVPLELVYAGRDPAGNQLWENVRPMPAGTVAVRADELPARTGLILEPAGRHA